MVQSNASLAITSNGLSNRDLDRRYVFEKIGYVKNEILVEATIAIVCALLGFAATTKIAVALTALCLGFAVPHIITGIIVGRMDPDRNHARALRFFFFAWGFFRAAVISILCVIVSSFVYLWVLPAGLQALIDYGQVYASALSGIFFAFVFPLAAIGCWYGIRCDGGVFFVASLTGMRRQSKSVLLPADLNPVKSCRVLGVASTCSLAVSITIWPLIILALCVPAVALPLAVMLSLLVFQFVIPCIWFFFFSGNFVYPWRKFPNSVDVL